MPERTTEVDITFVILACFAERLREKKTIVRDTDNLVLTPNQVAHYAKDRGWTVVSTDRTNLRRIYGELHKPVTFNKQTGLFKLHPNMLVGSNNEQLTMSLANWLGLHLDRYDPDVIKAAELSNIAAGQL